MLVGCYAISLLLLNVEVQPGWSIPFFIASSLLGYKLLAILLKPRYGYPGLELLLIVLLFIYLIASEYLLHKGPINNGYFISLGLNIVMMLLLVDEFYHNSAIKEIAMRFYVFGAVIVGILILFNIMTTISSSGRLTFMLRNENELAAALLVAYACLAIQFLGINFSSIFSFKMGCYLLSFAVLLNAIILTGTRFVILAVFVLIGLVFFFSLIRGHKRQSSLIFAAFCTACCTFLIVFGAKTFLQAGGFVDVTTKTNTVMMDRISSDKGGNNLTDLGGRIPLWQNSIDALIQSPLFGLGYENFLKSLMTANKTPALPHNFLLELAAIAGMTGVICLLLTAVCILRRGLSVSNRNRLLGFLISCIVLFFIMMSLNIGHLKIFWFFLACLITINYKKVA
jgi:O-antigen ligase